MAVAVRQNERLESASTRIERIADRARGSDGQGAFTIVKPSSIQQRLSRRLERPLSALESLDIGGRPVVGSTLAQPLEVPPQFVSDDVSQRHRDLRSRLFLHPISEAGHVRR